MEFEAIANAGQPHREAPHRAGQLVADKGATAVITGNVGPNAMNVRNAAGIEVYRGSGATVKENVELFKKGALSKISSTVPPHFGMGKR